MIGPFLLLIAVLAPLIMTASPGRSLVNVRPDRTTSKFHVYLHLSCHEDWGFVSERNGIFDEPISKVQKVIQNGTTPKFIQLSGEMYNIDEPGEEFEPYLFFTYMCGGDIWKEARYKLPYCFKEQKFCDYDLEVDLWNVPYEPSSTLLKIGKVVADSSNDETISVIP